MKIITTAPLARAERRVTMGDVDAAGILYFAAPYRWLEELFTGWLKATGHPLSEMLHQSEGCPAVASAASYLTPLKLDDEISLALHPSSIGRTSFSVTAVVRRVADDTMALKVSAWHVWTTFTAGDGAPELRPTPLPSWLRDNLRGAPLVDPVGSDPAQANALQQY